MLLDEQRVAEAVLPFLKVGKIATIPPPDVELEEDAEVEEEE